MGKKQRDWRQVYDSHTHLNDDPFYDDVPAFEDRAAYYGVTQMNIVGSNAKLNQRALDLGHRFSNLHPIIGWHPEDIRTFNEKARQTLRQQLDDPAVVGIGEIGLDYYNDEHSPHDQQQDIFEEQLAWARERHLPVSIHCREALADTYAILKNAHVGDFGGVMHSFNGSPEWAEKFLALGMAISFSGVASFGNAKDVHAAVQAVPLDRMMVETDAPYLTPAPFRGKQNEPAFTKFVVDAVADLKQVSFSQAAYHTYQNARRLFLKRHHDED
ncbi:MULTISPECIES: TatD family hydrolase [Limosilactobacillus]|uniref:Hydrolase, TatD family n=1 Tax=Limosilactobacillus panis DSM 6035 TaxID=1423782 RepID=A0A0R1XAY8_9LACO|nr:TatD family hydrolase [Limosilactobacillus panis]KRM26829.1 hydrolase, TatD family [Limosilactobacillus panis DSM 6035]